MNNFYSSSHHLRREIGGKKAGHVGVSSPVPHASAADEHKVPGFYNHPPHVPHLLLGGRGRVKSVHVTAEQLLQVRHKRPMPAHSKHQAPRRNKFANNAAIRSCELVDGISLQSLDALLAAHLLPVNADRGFILAERSPGRNTPDHKNEHDSQNDFHTRSPPAAMSEIPLNIIHRL